MSLMLKKKNKVWVGENGPKLLVGLASRNLLCMHYSLIALEWWFEFLYQKAGVLPESFIEIQFFLLLLVTILQVIPVP